MDNSAPLADYFWIAGIDSLSYDDEPFAGRDPSPNGPPPLSPAKIEATIEENADEELPSTPIKPGSSRATARHSQRNSWNQLNRNSYDARNSISTLEDLEGTRSNRSSMTIRGVSTGIENSLNSLTLAGTENSLDTSGTNGVEQSSSGFDFDKALIKFAQERESFLDDLTFSAGAQMHVAPPMTAQKSDKLRAEGSDIYGSTQTRKSPLRSVGGSIRRKLSFRDMSSVKRQSTVHRASKSTHCNCLYNRIIPPVSPPTL